MLEAAEVDALAVDDDVRQLFGKFDFGLLRGAKKKKPLTFQEALP